MNEIEIINYYFKKLSKKNPSSLNLNDDVFFDKNKNLVVSIDTYNENVHFPNFKEPDLIIKKILRSSISDLISKGVYPKYYFLSGAGNKKHFTKNNLTKIYKSLSNEQKKYNIKLSGGDTTTCNKISFTIASVGFAKNIIKRNNAKINDDIYITGNLGDSYLGLQSIKKKIKISNKLKKYFIDQYYSPNLPFNLCKKLYKFANTSMDVSDGLIADMVKLINKQKLSFEIDINLIPISKKLHLYLNKFNKDKCKFIFNGDDYQVLFTAPANKRKLINSYSKKMNQKITRIGKIVDGNKKNILKFNNKPLNISNFKGYLHNF